MSTGAPRTLNELFNQAMRKRANQVVMRYKRDRRWQDITGAQLDERVRNLALALHRLGVRAGDRVALLAESCPEWSVTDYARSEEHTSELQSRPHLVCRLLL